MHRGVYAVGHANLSPDGRWLAAVLTAGPEATLFQGSAAALLDLRRTSRPAVDIATPNRRGRTRAGINAHRAKLHPDDITTVRRIPCTSVARTLLDCADVLDRRGLERMAEQAEILRIFDLNAVRTVLDRADGRHGAALLEAVLQDLAHAKPPTRNDFEREFLLLCEQAGVPRPRVNAPLGQIEPDFLWPDGRLIVETDGYETHGTRPAFERDRERDRTLVVEGWRVVRFTWRQVTRRPDEVVDTLRALLLPS
ncbi:MAG: DUF559 domain-containing protein [Solirubrobacteraceae bacterium]